MRCRVVVYYSRAGAKLTTHQRVLLEADARVIAQIKKWDFDGLYLGPDSHRGNVFFVPDDTLLRDEASELGIRTEDDFFGGVVPNLFVKTKAITHPLVDASASRPPGWRPEFSRRVRDVVLPGYTAFAIDDARIAAQRLVARGVARVKNTLDSGGKGQIVVRSMPEFDEMLEKIPADRLATHGLVLELNLPDVKTISVGKVAVDGTMIVYHGRQRLALDNSERWVYGGSSLVCIRGDWEELERLAAPPEVRHAIRQARTYDEAMSEYRGFIASRRNYDVAVGTDEKGSWHSGVLEASWRVGGASPAELSALRMFALDSELQVIEVSHVEEFGSAQKAPAEAIVHFAGNDPRDGPILRYTLVTGTQRAH